MASRREFIQAGLLQASFAASVLPLVGQAHQIGQSPAPTSFYKVIVDQRFAESAAFGEKMRNLGVSVHSIEGDITDFWYHDLYSQWKENPAPIAGLTAHGPLFCLERLAWDHGMRVVFRAEHKQGEGCVEHTFAGPSNVLASAADLRNSRPWPVQLAHILSAFPPERSEKAQAAMVTPSSSTGSETLYSWVIAAK